MKSTNITKGHLSQRRLALETQWNKFLHEQNPLSAAEAVNQDIVSSWQRSVKHVQVSKESAPVEDEYVTLQHWEESPLSRAAQREQEHMIALANEGELVAAIADPSGRLLWIFASRHMRKRAESVNFSAGGRWDENSFGTNAIGLSQRLQRSVTVFSSEHYQPCLHDWVCYAAPIIHPHSGECMGILDMSTTWNRHTPLGQAAVAELARSIAYNLPRDLPRAELEIYALGQQRVMFRGKPLQLTRRQLEVLSLLALNPPGLNLQEFHAALYGDAPVSTTTLKAELSHLRRVLDGKIGSRPYRLLVPVWADFIHVWQALRENKTTEAFSLYRGSLLPQSESPELEEWRHCIDAVMGQALNECGDPNLLIDRVCQNTAGNEMVRERLLELLPSSLKI